MLEPIERKSRTLKLDPSLDMPYVDNVEPKRTKVRRLTELPIVTKSKMLSEDPKRLMP
jgi:hypothetical protein